MKALEEELAQAHAQAAGWEGAISMMSGQMDMLEQRLAAAEQETQQATARVKELEGLLVKAEEEARRATEQAK